MTRDTRIRFTFRIPEQLLSELKAEAENTGVSINALILQILWKWTGKEKT